MQCPSTDGLWPKHPLHPEHRQVHEQRGLGDARCMQHALERQADAMEHADLRVISDVACNHLGAPAEGAQTLTEALSGSRHASRT